MKRCELGYAVWVLYYRLWDTPYTEPPNKPRTYWRDVKRKELNSPDVICEEIKDHFPVMESPIPFEIEMGIPDLNYEMLMKAWKKLINK